MMRFKAASPEIAVRHRSVSVHEQGYLGNGGELMTIVLWVGQSRKDQEQLRCMHCASSDDVRQVL